MNGLTIAANKVPDSAEEIIVQTVSDISAACFPGQIRALVLTGSLARKEGTWLQSGGRTRLAGDAEFLLIFQDQKPLPETIAVKRLSAEAEATLAKYGIEASIDLSPVLEAYLRALRPHIFAYELIFHGKVITGERDILQLVPRFRPADIPLEDGFRMLMNRMVELLEAICEAGYLQSDRVQYTMIKLWLDMATSFLLFEGRYEPGYRARAACMRELAAQGLTAPIPIEHFVERVDYATSIKLRPGARAAVVGEADFGSFVANVHKLWRWQLQRLTGLQEDAGDDVLRRTWSRAQPMQEKLRGWASAMKRSTDLRNLTSAMRMLTLCRVSPRRLIYSAASELFFSIPELRKRRQPGTDLKSWNRAWRKLPIELNRHDGPVNEWRSFGRAIARNYHQLLTATRS